MTRPASVTCPTCDAQPLLPCVGEDGAVLRHCHPDRYTAAGTEEAVSLWRSMSGAAVDAASRAQEATRGTPGTAPPVVVDEDVAARRRS